VRQLCGGSGKLIGAVDSRRPWLVFMRITLNATGGSRIYDSGLGRFSDAEIIPCFRCGVCCQRWQPLVSLAEAERLGQFLQMDADAVLAVHARPYPLAEDTYILNERNGGCTFLAFDDGRATCTVHEARPYACRDWDASLHRKECLDGLRQVQPVGEPFQPIRLYDNDADAAAFLCRIRGDRPGG